MRLLLDENVPIPLHRVLSTFILTHEIVHLLELQGWSGTRDEYLYPQAAAEGFHVVLTNDGRQMQRPREVAAIAASGVHRIEYPHKHRGLAGMGIAIATVAAGLPSALTMLEEADGQRLITLRGVDPTAASRLHVVDPKVSPPKFWFTAL
ncbi:PIN-like domain-containing protein [Sphaerisporangium aureirubrum]|uniref:VapC45 PIN like domain-containing protein n=1 Tax=Sphaerisporangium aureirubrum TaxID=1544736 RepID=A0ABW1NAW6_9ACTN